MELSFVRRAASAAASYLLSPAVIYVSQGSFKWRLTFVVKGFLVVFGLLFTLTVAVSVSILGGNSFVESWVGCATLGSI